VVTKQGSVVVQADYTPTGQMRLGPGQPLPALGFGGHWVHPVTGLLFAWFRAYDPDLGRWLSRDPLGQRQGESLYAYGGGDPINHLDPYGLQSRLGTLPQNSYSSQIQEGVDTYKTAQQVGQKIESAVEGGLKLDKVILKEKEAFKNAKLEEAKKNLTGSPLEEQERLLEQSQKTAQQGVDPLGRVLKDKTQPIIDALGGCTPPSPSGPKLRPRSSSPKPPPSQPGFLDWVAEQLGFNDPPPTKPVTIKDSVGQARELNRRLEAQSAQEY
jgi:RHS repeat-associated protein